MIRQRSRRACDPCRKRKVKCNGTFPCDICQGYGYDCDYTADQNKRLKGTKSSEDAFGSQAKDRTLSGHDGFTHSPKDVKATMSMPSASCHEQKSFMLVEVANRKDPTLASAPFPESLISRFTTTCSAVAFPRELGLSLGLANAPRLHPFGWNTGTREERVPSLSTKLFDQVTLQDALHYSSVYFKILHPVVGLCDQTHFTESCIAAWGLRQIHADLVATVCGVIALGSLFSADPVPWRMEYFVVDQAKVLLDISISSPPSQLSVKFVVAWLLRAIYLRCTTRPHLSWMATCNAVHIAEALGLHKEFGTVELLHERSREVVTKEAVARRRTFWTVLSLNRLFSIEYGRSPIFLESITCSELEQSGEGDLVRDFVSLCQLLPTSRDVAGMLPREKEELPTSLQRLTEHSNNNAPFALLRADICFMIFRKMRSRRIVLGKSEAEAILSIIQTGLLEALSLSKTRSKWWNVISVPLHSVAVLIAMDSSASLSMLSHAFETLQKVTHAYNTHLSREALQVVEQLVRGCQGKKLEEAAWLGRVLQTKDHDPAPQCDEQNAQATPMSPTRVEWPDRDDGGWMEVFLNMDMEF